MDKLPPNQREYHLLKLRADTFAFELEQERKLRLKGAGTLPPEWDAYLEDERQKIQDEVYKIELRSPELAFTSPFKDWQQALMLQLQTKRKLASLVTRNDSVDASALSSKAEGKSTSTYVEPNIILIVPFRPLLDTTTVYLPEGQSGYTSSAVHHHPSLSETPAERRSRAIPGMFNGGHELR